jgi:hypothetical protein
MLYDIKQPAFSEEFARCWSVAGKHLHAQGDGRINWLKADLDGPSLEHLSFRLGNQLFFVMLEDIDRKLAIPRNDAGLHRIADGCNGVPCIMLMSKRSGSWAPHRTGWGLIDARTGHDIDPVALITDARIEMTDWEVHDFAVQVVRQNLEDEGRQIMSTQGDPSLDPSIWFVGRSGPEWVIVRSARMPATDPEQPDNWPAIAEQCKAMGTVGYFASVVVASRGDAFDPNVPSRPLWRGHPMAVRFKGLQQLGKKGLLSSVLRGRS